MRSKRVLGIVVVLIGVIMLFASSYINKRVNEGRGEISSAQQKVDMGNSLFSLNPTTQEIGKGITSPAQQKIDAGQVEVNEYAKMAQWLKVGGIIAVVIGAGLFLFGGKKRSYR